MRKSTRRKSPRQRTPGAAHNGSDGCMPQNIYDDPAFFAGYSRLPRSREGLAGAPEWPALRRGPSQEQIAQHPEWADEVHRPPFLLVAARL